MHMDVSTCAYVCGLSRNETVINKAELLLFFQQMYADSKSADFPFSLTDSLSIAPSFISRRPVYMIRYSRNSIIPNAI